MNLFCCGLRIRGLIFSLEEMGIDRLIFIELFRTGVSVKCLGQQDQFDLLGEALGLRRWASGAVEYCLT